MLISETPFLRLPSAFGRGKLIRTEISGRRFFSCASKLKLFFRRFLELPWGIYTYRSFWRIFWRSFLTNILDEFFDEFFWQIDEFFWRISKTNILMNSLTNFWIFLMNFFDELFDKFLTNFLTYNLLTIASFRIGVPSILFLNKSS